MRPPGGEKVNAIAIDVALALAAVAVSLWVFRSVLGSYFSPDDVIYFERVTGLAPQSPGLWRWLSGHVAVGLLHEAFGRAPRPYFVVTLALHAANVSLLYGLVRTWSGGRLAATAAAALFGTSRLSFTVLAQVVTVADLLALGFMLAAVIVATRRGRLAAVAAVTAACAAVLAKESVAALPLVLLLPRPGAPPLRQRALRCGLLLFPGLLMAAHVATPGVGSAVFKSAYERSYGPHMFHSLVSFADWSFDMETRIPDLFSAASPPAWTTWVWLAGLLGLAWLARRATAVPLLGMSWWVLGLAPVLPLVSQRYTHYLYASLAGLAMAIGGLLEWACLGVPAPARRAGGPRRVLAWTLAATLVAGHAVRSASLLAAREAQVIHGPDLPFDPFTRKRELLRRMAEGLEPVASQPHARVVILIPRANAPRYVELLRSVADEGRGLRALFPTCDSLVMVQRWPSGHRDDDLVAGVVDGRLVPLGRGMQAHERFANLVEAAGYPAEAREHLAAARSDDGEAPADSTAPTR